MHAEEYARRYAAADVNVPDRGRLLLLVFEGGLKFLRLTRDALAAGDFRRFAEHLGRAQAIVSELLATLDREAGGEIAADLARLYDFMLFHLTEANVRKSVRHVEQVIGVFATIAGAYREVIESRSAMPADAAADAR
jgi:flagellar protein FliS